MIGDHVPVSDIFAQESQNDEIRKSLIEQAQRTLLNNQECYVAQWILHNPDKNPQDYRLQFEWAQHGNGYNVYMVKREDM